MIQAKIKPNLKPALLFYEPKNAGITENICISCPLEECKPNECKRYKEEKEKLLKSLKRRRMK